MSKKREYGDEPIGEVTRVADFVPPSSELVPREDTVKVTLALSKQSVAFFKEQAALYKVPYQRMIRSLVDEYVERYVSESS
jgi:predicted DNA binding CopG/RHH family protein